MTGMQAGPEFAYIGARTMPVIPFQIMTIVRLMTPAQAEAPTRLDDQVFKDHLAYLRDLVKQGKILANGPAKRIDDPMLRGISLYLVGAEEARELALQDPAVKAGCFEIMVDQWMIPVDPKMIADRTDFEMEVPF